MIDTTFLRQCADEIDAQAAIIAELEARLGVVYGEGDNLSRCENERDMLRTENARLRAALMRVGDDYPGSSCQQWCYEQAGIAPMIDHAPDPLHVTIEDASIKRAAAFIAFGVENDGLRAENARQQEDLTTMVDALNIYLSEIEFLRAHHDIAVSLGNAQRVRAEKAENERDALRTELAKRAKQIGVACLKHDLTHSLACGHCQEELDELVRDVVERDSMLGMGWIERAKKALGK